MKKSATFDQALHFLQLVQEQKLSCQQLQDIINSGLLSDLLKVKDLSEVNRDAVRLGLGLKVLFAPVTINVNPLARLKQDMHQKKGWELMEDVDEPTGRLELELVEFFHSSGEWLLGGEFLEKAQKVKPVLGQRHAESLLKVQHEIVEGWERFVIPFPGTVWRDPAYGVYCVPCIHSTRHDGWKLGFRHLFNTGEDWIDNFRLVRPRQ